MKKLYALILGVAAIGCYQKSLLGRVVEAVRSPKNVEEAIEFIQNFGEEEEVEAPHNASEIEATQNSPEMIESLQDAPEEMAERCTFDEAVNELVSGYWDAIADRPVHIMNEMLVIRAARDALSVGVLSIDGIKNYLRNALIASGNMKSEAAVEEYVEQLAAHIQQVPTKFTRLYEMAKQSRQGQ